MLPSIHNSPLATLKAVENYCRGEGTLADIAQSLEVDPHRFQAVTEWYLTNWREPFSDEQPSPQTLLNIILLQLLRSYRLTLIKYSKRIDQLEKKLRRLNTPYRV